LGSVYAEKGLYEEAQTAHEKAAAANPDWRWALARTYAMARRSDDGLWCLPCGWVEPNESPEEAAVREAREETGLEVQPRQLVGVFTRKPNVGHGPHSAIAIIYLCDLVGGTPRRSHEVVETRYWRITEVPGWHEMHQKYAEAAHGAWQGRQASHSSD